MVGHLPAFYLRNDITIALRIFRWKGEGGRLGETSRFWNSISSGTRVEEKKVNNRTGNVNKLCRTN